MVNGLYGNIGVNSISGGAAMDTRGSHGSEVADRVRAIVEDADGHHAGIGATRRPGGRAISYTPEPSSTMQLDDGDGNLEARATAIPRATAVTSGAAEEGEKPVGQSLGALATVST